MYRFEQEFDSPLRKLYLRIDFPRMGKINSIHFENSGYKRSRYD